MSGGDIKRHDGVVGEIHEVVKRNCGPMFGHPEWWMFNCPVCNAQLVRKDNSHECDCGTLLDWDGER